MKKFMTMLICLGATSTFLAQTTLVKQAEKLSGKPDKLAEARNMIKEAMANPETQNDAYTYYVAGKIELDAYDNAYKTKMINPDDPSTNPIVMGDELIGAYNYFLQALPLDSLPNDKGQVKPKYSKDILNRLKGHQSDFFGVGADLYNAKEYYPGAYNAFMVYGNMPVILNIDDPTLFPPQQVATAFFNAGLAASQGNATEASAEAFKKARLAGYEQPEAYIYEIACYQKIAQDDESQIDVVQDKILEAAQAGIDKFGLEQRIFLNNLINSLVTENKTDQALAKLNELIASNPDNANLFGLRGYVYDRLGKDDLSEADYRKGADLPTADFEILKNASNKLYRVGTAKLNALEGSADEVGSAREAVKNDYFLQAQKYAQQANEMQPGDSFIQNILDSIDYALTTFF